MQTDYTAIAERADRIAAALSTPKQTWQATTRPDMYAVEITNASGEIVRIAESSHKRKLTLSGVLTGGLWQYTSRQFKTTIYASASRSNAAIASEITRRLLPAYRAERAIAQAEKIEHDARIS